jgi:hypothetical protein
MSSPQGGAEAQRSVREELEVAARDLWTMIEDSGDSYIVFMDRRRLFTRVQQEADGLFSVSWQGEDAEWVTYSERFENLRQAAFHAYQGPH